MAVFVSLELVPAGFFSEGIDGAASELAAAASHLETDSEVGRVLAFQVVLASEEVGGEVVAGCCCFFEELIFVGREASNLLYLKWRRIAQDIHALQCKSKRVYRSHM